jgi:hypothetical protein
MAAEVRRLVTAATPSIDVSPALEPEALDDEFLFGRLRAVERTLVVQPWSANAARVAASWPRGSRPMLTPCPELSSSALKRA